jgi:hypothetical protein
MRIEEILIKTVMKVAVFLLKYANLEVEIRAFTHDKRDRPI